MQDGKQEFGDVIEAALSAVGVTSSRVEAWLGRPCGCPERRERINQVHRWAKRVVAGKTAKAKEYLERIIS